MIFVQSNKMKWLTVAMMLAAALTVQGSDEENSVQAQHGHLWAVLLAGSNSWMNYRHQVCISVLLFIYFELKVS